MNRAISSFKLDQAGEWTAILSCGHPQHTRHRPPFELRPWVISEEGRDSKIGSFLNCVRCDDFELPLDAVMQRTSPEFNETTLPAALKNNHFTKPGVWGKIIIVEGRLLYHIEALKLDMELVPERSGIIVPELAHRVEPVGTVRFFIEFYSIPQIVSI